MPRVLVVLATACIEDHDHCSWRCPLFSREGGAHCRQVDAESFVKNSVRTSPLRAELKLDGRNELYLRTSLCKMTYMSYASV